jgi:hypothetical protein
MNRAFIRPINGKSMRCPDTGDILPPAGRYVEMTSYWRRRLAENAIEMTKPPVKKTAEKPAKGDNA